jgi:hypothetical protein
LMFMVCPPQDCTGSEPVERVTLIQRWSRGNDPSAL